MTKKATPTEKPAIAVSAGADSPFLLYAEGELAEKATGEDFSVVQNEGLDAHQN